MAILLETRTLSTENREVTIYIAGCTKRDMPAAMNMSLEWLKVIQTMPTRGLSIPCLALTDACTSFAILNFIYYENIKHLKMIYKSDGHFTNQIVSS